MNLESDCLLYGEQLRHTLKLSLMLVKLEVLFQALLTTVLSSIKLIIKLTMEALHFNH